MSAFYKDRLGYDVGDNHDPGLQPIYEEKLSKSKGLWQLFVEATSGTQCCHNSTTKKAWFGLKCVYMSCGLTVFFFNTNFNGLFHKVFFEK